MKHRAKISAIFFLPHALMRNSELQATLKQKIEKWNIKVMTR